MILGVAVGKLQFLGQTVAHLRRCMLKRPRSLTMASNSLLVHMRDNAHCTENVRQLIKLLSGFQARPVSLINQRTDAASYSTVKRGCLVLSRMQENGVQHFHGCWVVTIQNLH